MLWPFRRVVEWYAHVCCGGMRDGEGNCEEVGVSSAQNSAQSRICLAMILFDDTLQKLESSTRFARIDFTDQGLRADDISRCLHHQLPCSINDK